MTEAPAPDPAELTPELELPARPIGRRAFLGLAAAGVGGILVAGRVADAINGSPVGRAVQSSGLANVVPIGEPFRYYTITGEFPSRAPADYRLKVRGLVDRPLDLGYDDLVGRRPTHLTKDFQCVTGWRVRGVEWTGVALGALLDEAGVRANAAAVRFTSFDGAYTESLTLAQARRPDVIVAYQLQGGGISSMHGGPVRLYVAPMYGYKSLKWLDTIEVVDRVVPGYWEQNGYDVDAWIGKSNGRSDNPV